MQHDHALFEPHRSRILLMSTDINTGSAHAFSDSQVPFTSSHLKVECCSDDSRNKPLLFLFPHSKCLFPIPNSLQHHMAFPLLVLCCL